jgi:hypothetical protein
MSLTLRLKALPTATAALDVALKRDSLRRVNLCAIRNFRTANDLLAATWTRKLKPTHCRGL